MVVDKRLTVSTLSVLLVRDAGAVVVGEFLPNAVGRDGKFFVVNNEDSMALLGLAAFALSLSFIVGLLLPSSPPSRSLGDVGGTVTVKTFVGASTVVVPL